jgi:putative FmdB family regulatory protein
MPFYEYQCQACGAQTEVLQKISDAPLRKCPDCGKARLVKLVSAPIFRLKGGGWYETDFKSDQDKKRNLAGAEKDTPAAADAESKPKAAKTVSEGGEKPASAKPSPVKPKARAKAKAAKKAKART